MTVLIEVVNRDGEIIQEITVNPESMDSQAYEGYIDLPGKIWSTVWTLTPTKRFAIPSGGRIEVS